MRTLSTYELDHVSGGKKGGKGGGGSSGGGSVETCTKVSTERTIGNVTITITTETCVKKSN
jgi:hypothetical protein